ncbi:MAG: hypothetical protein ACYDBB_04655 [Armatimonadota bacterium]
MRPDLRLAYLDETEHWAEEIVRSAGRIAGIYVYDARLRVHCCEITASYELHLACYLTEHHIGDAVQVEMLQATDAGSVRYFHSWRVDGFRRARRRPGFRDADHFVPGGMPCTLPGPWPSDRDAAIAEALAMLTQCGYTTT